MSSILRNHHRWQASWHHLNAKGWLQNTGFTCDNEEQIIDDSVDTGRNFSYKKGNRKEKQAECVEGPWVKICCKRICLFEPKEGSDQISTVSSFF